MKLFSKCLSTGLCLSMIAGLTACSNDDWKDVDGGAPQLQLKSSHERTEAGRNINISGEVADNDGISTIDLVCHELNLNKRINLIEIYGEPQKSYNLDYSFKIQENETGDDFTIDVVITDIGGRKETQQVKVTLDGDFRAPVFTAAPDKEITVILKPSTFFNLQFTVEDNRVVDYVEIDIKDVTAGEEGAQSLSGFPRKVDGNGSGKLEFAERLSLPSEEAVLLASMTAYDKEANEAAHSTAITSKINVQPLPDFEKIYLCDVATAAELNSDVFGVPVVMDHVGPYKYRIRYYNETAGTEICFLAQKTDFGPICFGTDPSDRNVLGDDPSEVGRIKLDKASSYYLIDINTFDRTYSLSNYPVSEAINPVMHLHYGQNDLNTWWVTDPEKENEIDWREWYFGPATGTSDAKKMIQDKNNPNIFIYEDWKLEGGEKMNFFLHNWHPSPWWNFTTWRVDDSSDPSVFAYYGNYIPKTSHYESNYDYFKFKYIDMNPEEFKFMYPNAGDSFNLNSWGDESYRKNFIPDNWVKPEVKVSGTYKLIFDAHTERARLVPQN